MDLKLKNNSKLSIPYIEIEYLESTGTQWIDTGINISPTMGVFVDFQLSVVNTTHQALFGYIDGRSSISVDKDYCFYKDSNTGKYIISCSPNSTTNTEISADTNRHTLHFNITNRVILVDNGNTYSTTLSTAPTNTADKTCPIFGRKYTNASNVSSWSIGGNIRIYKFQIYNNGSLFRNFIPVLDNRGIPCMYETKSNTFFYNAGTGDFIVPFNIFKNITTAYIENCPNINKINLLRGCPNLTNVRCDIDNVSGTLAELQHYVTLHGFNNHEEPDNTTAPTINGTFTITDWYTNEELQALQGFITGLTIVVDSSKNIDTALINEDFAIQTLDSTKVNYNPAAAIRLQASGYGITRNTPSTATKGNWFITKDEVATITSLERTIFGGIASATDNNKIVSNDDTEEYLFTSFDEFRYFTGMTSIPNGPTTYPRNIFASCSNLQSITLPEGMTTIGTYTFFDLSNLTRLTLPSTITFIRNYNFSSSGYVPNLHTVYFNGTLNQWMTFTRYANDNTSNPCVSGADLYIQGELLENLVIPENITSIIAVCFSGVRSITNIVFHQNITSIGDKAFCNCTGLTGDIVIPDSVTSIGNSAFNGCNNIQDLIFETTANVSNNAFEKCGNGSGLLYISGNLSRVDRSQDNHFKDVIIKGDYIHTNDYYFCTRPCLTTFRIKGLLSITNGELVYTYSNGPSNLSFVEIMGDCDGSVLHGSNNPWIGVGDNCIIHLGRNQKVTSTPTQIMSTYVNTQNKVSKIYIGDGSSASHDQQILNLYIADTDWASFSSKLDLWYNYNGEYRTYTVAENLTDCINSNPIDWPYITRGESYQTTIIPDEGMTLDSVTVEMYEAVDNGTTPNIPTNITSQVYNSSTGEINIPSVTGNVVITANAS